MENNNILNEEIIERKHPLTVISKATSGEYNIRDIQDNSSWSTNPYPNDYVVVPDEMVEAINETRGFVDIVLNEEGTELLSFNPREIPEIKEEEPEPSLEDRVSEHDSEITSLREENSLLTECVLEMSSIIYGE